MARHMAVAPSPRTQLHPVARVPLTPVVASPYWYVLSTSLRDTFQPELSRNHLHAHLVLVARLERVLNRQYRPQRGDGHGQLRQVGFARGQALELHARPHQDPGPALG